MPLSHFKGSSSSGAGAGGSSEDGGRKSSLKNADRVRKDRKDRSRSPVGDERAEMEEDPDELEVVPVRGTIPPLPGFKFGGSLSNSEVGVGGKDGKRKVEEEGKEEEGKEGETEEEGKRRKLKEEEERKRKEKISLEDVMGAIQTLSVDVNSKFVSVENCLLEFRAELGALKAEMVSRQMFDKLEARVSDLELKGFACPDLEFLRQ